KQEDGSYIVVNANGFKYMSDKSLATNVVLNIGADIDFGGATVNAILVPYNGSLVVNGNNYTLSNVKVASGAKDNTSGQASLFYCYQGSTLTVSNLAVSGATVQANINGSGYAGVIVGYNEGATTLTDVDVKNSTVNGEKSCAILVGFVPVYGTLTMNGCDVGVDCAVNATEDRAAAYAGRVYGATTITTCSVADDFVATATDGWASKYIGQRYVGCTTCTIDGVEYVDANSVQDLIERATEGTTLVLNECGMEYPTLVIRNADGSPKRNFAVQTNPGEKANVMNLTLKANGNVVLGFVDLNGSTNIVLDGFTFDAAKAQVVKSCSRGSFVDTEYSANIAFAQGQTISARYVTIKNCTFEGNSTATQYAPICVQDAGRATGPAGDITVDKCTFNCDVFRYLSLDYVAYGTVIITNNTFGGANYANTTGHNAINGTSCGANFVITGNTFNGWKDGEAAIGISKSTVAEERTIVVKNNKFYFQAADANFTADIVYLKSSATAKTFDTFHKLTEMSGNEYFDALAGRADENVTAADYYTTVATTVNAAQAAGEKYCVITNVLKYKVK
ncbi:MAG: hypothetical protein IJW60_04710, partial [Clostridia bacterium]|nr:hypothetical protein [Clostridia bacterium]